MKKDKLDKVVDFFYLHSFMFEQMPSTLGQYEELEDRYLKVLKKYCKKWLNINFKNTMKILNGMSDQNWKKLHETDEEENLTAEDFLKRFDGEFSYACDRFSYSRMLRIHWEWIMFSKRFFKELMAEQGLDFLSDEYYDYYDYLNDRYGDV